MTTATTTARSIPSRGEGLGAFLRRELRPKGRLLTPFNVISSAFILATVAILAVRFTYGLGAVTNLDQRFPWGLWIGFDVLTGVAFAGGAYMITFLVYILRMEQYRSIVRVTVLNGFLAYVFYAGALLIDLGRPWNVVNPIIGNDFGLTSVLFLVAWHFMLYMMAELVEFSPAVAEWLGLERIRRVLKGLTVGAVIFGITLSTLHQSGLGALYLMAKPKIHPLWYTELLPVLFFVSSMFAGLSMVIFEGSITRRVFDRRVGPELARSHEDILVSLSRICGGVMFAYLWLQVLAFLHGQSWRYLSGGWGAWYLVEVLGLTALPMTLFVLGGRWQRVGVIRTAALLAMVGVAVNRLNVSTIAFKWYEVGHYIPSWMEVVVTGGILCAEIWVFRWVVLRLPVLGASTVRSHEQLPAGESETAHAAAA
jgi:Ni/Fe-hydrogenase subunit HybB-like protein